MKIGSLQKESNHMGVDYDAVFDIGFKIIAFPKSLDEEFDNNKDIMIETTLRNTPYQYISWGDGCYGGTDYIAVVLAEPLIPFNASDEIFLDLKKRLVDLHDFLIDHGFEIDNKWITGGLSVW